MNTAVDIDDLHDAIKDAFTTAFPDAFVDFYSRPGEKVQTPAILLEIEDILADDPDGNGCEQLNVTLNCNAYVVLSYKAGQKKALRKFAASVMAFVRGKRWGLPVGAANVGSAQPDQFTGQQDDYEVMRVEFSHEALLGTDVFEGNGPFPTRMFLGFAPEIGPDHVDDYVEVEDLPQFPP